MVSKSSSDLIPPEEPGPLACTPPAHVKLGDVRQYWENHENAPNDIFTHIFFSGPTQHSKNANVYAISYLPIPNLKSEVYLIVKRRHIPDSAAVGAKVLDKCQSAHRVQLSPSPCLPSEEGFAFPIREEKRCEFK